MINCVTGLMGLGADCKCHLAEDILSSNLIVSIALGQRVYIANTHELALNKKHTKLSWQHFAFRMVH